MSNDYQDGAQRYYAKRAAGIPATGQGSMSPSPERDRQAAAAEKFAADYLGCPFNAEVYSTHGDPGYDFIYPIEVEVYHIQNPTGEYLIVFMDKPKAWADVYVVVIGTIETGFNIAGWTTHRELIKRPPKDFGHGKRYAMHIKDLFPIERMTSIKVRREMPK